VFYISGLVALGIFLAFLFMMSRTPSKAPEPTPFERFSGELQSIPVEIDALVLGNTSVAYVDAFATVAHQHPGLSLVMADESRQAWFAINETHLGEAACTRAVITPIPGYRLSSVNAIDIEAGGRGACRESNMMVYVHSS
jgi:hypothetical protein